MATFTLADLLEYVRQGGGEDDALNLNGQIAETTFVDLGYDSIAIVEITLLIERGLGIKLPETADKNATPAQFVDLVNELLSELVQP
ncbi:phosphopantetheine-binding protein [Kitasatospora sp. NPDC028055]|uniref:acyl carrier protein n=1 Tax=Kitasatospora sp. NPDC028055 TaxID=3155653 RepID=UPI0033DA90BA